MSYKLISFDLDGTLLKNLHEISDENYEALKKLHEMGIFLVPTSGRSLYEIPEKVRKCEYFKYAITSGGACTYDLESGKMIASELMSKDESKFIFDKLFATKNVTMTHYQGESYVDCTQDMAYYDSCRVTEGFKEFIPLMDKAVEGFEKSCYEMDGVELTCSFISTDEELNRLREEIKETGDYTVVSSAKNNIEIVSSRVNKGKAVLSLAANLGIGQQETIGVGDSINDLALIKAVGLGIAMENAVDELKEFADEIGCRYTEHIAKYILERYFA